MPEFVFDGSSMDELVRDLREAATRVDAEVEKTALAIGEELAETAKKIAGEHSSTIPGTIRMTPIPHGVSIRAGNAQVPLAALYDLGNVGKGGRKSDTFRHPAWGRWNVADPSVLDQKRYPFFAPARKLMRRQITKRMNSTWDDALGPLTHD